MSASVGGYALGVLSSKFYHRHLLTRHIQSPGRGLVALLAPKTVKDLRSTSGSASLPFPLDDLVLEAIANSLAFVERVRFEATNSRYARIAFSDRRRQNLFIVVDHSEYRIDIGQWEKVPSIDNLIFIKSAEDLDKMLWAIFSRVVKWRCISVECGSFVFNDRQSTIFDSVFEALAGVGRSVNVYKLDATLSCDPTLFDGNFANFLMARLTVYRLEQLIEQCSARLRRLSLVLWLWSAVTNDVLETLVMAIGRCQRLRSLYIRDWHDQEHWRSLPPILCQLPKLTTLQLFDHGGLCLSSHTVYISEHWLPTFAQVIFQPLLSRMKEFYVQQKNFDLPLAAENMAASVAVAASMRPSMPILFHHPFFEYGQPLLDWIRPASLDLVLGAFLRIAKDKKNANIHLFVAHFPPTVAQFLAAIASLPVDLCQGLSTPTIANVRAGQHRLDFRYKDAGRVKLRCYKQLVLNSVDNIVAGEDSYYQVDWLFGDHHLPV